MFKTAPQERVNTAVFNSGVQDRLATAVFNTGSITVHRVQDRGGEPVSNMCLDTGPSFRDAAGSSTCGTYSKVKMGTSSSPHCQSKESIPMTAPSSRCFLYNHTPS